MSWKPNFIQSLDQNGVKYCIFKVVEPEVNYTVLKLGTIGRRNTPEYDAAFPELPKAPAERSKMSHQSPFS